MGKIVVKLAGRELCEWAGEKRDMRDLTRRLERAAKSVRKTLPELVSLTMQSIVGAGNLSFDPSIRDMQIGVLAHYVLQLPTEPPAKFATHGEFVAVGSDLVVDLQREGRGSLRVDVAGLPQA